jgi:acetyltransferase-like isoleucine patch superfamily enzyme
MSHQQQDKAKGYEYAFADVVMVLYASLVYFSCFAGPIYLLWSFRRAPLYILLLLTVMGMVAAPLTFIGILVLTRTLLLNNPPTGRLSMKDPKVYGWIFAIRVMVFYMGTPLRAIINDHMIFRYVFYRGMGAKLYADTLLASGVMLTDPWAISIGRHTVVGHEACITGHLIQDQEVLFGRVEIGEDVVIGARAFIWPDVKIGHGAKIAAYSVVARGTVIPPKEVWGGIPARKLSGASAAQTSLELTLSGLPHAEASLKAPFS